jgi:hypothetical protein
MERGERELRELRGESAETASPPPDTQLQPSSSDTQTSSSSSSSTRRKSIDAEVEWLEEPGRKAQEVFTPSAKESDSEAAARVERMEGSLAESQPWAGQKAETDEATASAMKQIDEQRAKAAATAGMPAPAPSEGSAGGSGGGASGGAAMSRQNEIPDLNQPSDKVLEGATAPAATEEQSSETTKRGTDAEYDKMPALPSDQVRGGRGDPLSNIILCMDKGKEKDRGSTFSEEKLARERGLDVLLRRRRRRRQLLLEPAATAVRVPPVSHLTAHRPTFRSTLPTKKPFPRRRAWLRLRP